MYGIQLVIQLIPQTPTETTLVPGFSVESPGRFFPLGFLIQDLKYYDVKSFLSLT